MIEVLAESGQNSHAIYLRLQPKSFGRNIRFDWILGERMSLFSITLSLSIARLVEEQESQMSIEEDVIHKKRL